MKYLHCSRDKHLHLCLIKWVIVVYRLLIIRFCIKTHTGERPIFALLWRVEEWFFNVAERHCLLGSLTSVGFPVSYFPRMTCYNHTVERLCEGQKPFFTQVAALGGREKSLQLNDT